MEKNMSGTVVVKEKRTLKKILSDRYNKEIEKLAAMTPEEYDKQLMIRKRAIQVAGNAATLALVACPADGPFGEILTAIATPVLAEIVEGVGKMFKPMVFGMQKKLCAKLINKDGVTDYQVNAAEYIESMKTLGQNISEFKGRAI